jgi:hypothetical protein
MTESDSIPRTAPVDPIKKITGWEIFLRCFLLLLGIFLGIVVASVIAVATGWFRIEC